MLAESRNNSRNMFQPYCLSRELLQLKDCFRYQREGVIYGLLTKLLWSKWLDIGQVLFPCLWTETQSKAINTQKRMRPISTHFEQPSSIKGLIHVFWENSSRGTQQVVSNGQDGAAWKPITTQNLIHHARSQSKPYNKVLQSKPLVTNIFLL